MPDAFVTRRRVEFGDTDMAGIVHFSNFFRYMEAAETDFLHSRGLSVTWREGGTRFGLPRVSAACDYKSPARFADAIGASDGRYFAEDGIEIVNFGPGGGAEGHAANEFVTASELETSAAIHLALVERLLGLRS